jgi:hypothetical protein
VEDIEEGIGEGIVEDIEEDNMVDVEVLVVVADRAFAGMDLVAFVGEVELAWKNKILKAFLVVEMEVAHLEVALVKKNKIVKEY